VKIGYISDFTVLGGLNVHLIGLMQHARSHGWHVSALLDEGSAGMKVAQMLRQMDCPAETAGLYRRHYAEANIRRSLDRWLAKTRPDALHLHDGSPRSNLIAKEAAAEFAIPVYCSVHFVPKDLAVSKVDLERMKRAFASLHGLIMNSRYCAEVLRGHGLTCDNETQIHYGVSTGREMTRRTAYAPSGPCRILAMTRGETRKGLQQVLGIFAKLAQYGHTSWTLTLAGDYQPHLVLPLLNHLAIPEQMVHLIGWQDDFLSRYHSHDLLVMCSTEEGTPISLLEALATGMPVFASRLEGTLELLRDSRCCELLPSADVSAWSDAICSFIQNPEALNRRASLGPALVRQNYNASQQLDKIMRFIHDSFHLRNRPSNADAKERGPCR